MSTSESASPHEPLAAVTIAISYGILRARITGELDMSNADHVTRSLLDAADGTSGVIVDIAAVEFLDSHGIAGLFHLHQHLTGANQTFLIVTGARTTAGRVLHLAGMDQVMRLQQNAKDPQPF
jgi:anti-anti-sigma factor